MLEELKAWDDKVWAKFKRENYETINLGFELNEKIDGQIYPEGKVLIGKRWFKRQ